MKTRITEKPASMENATTAEKEGTGRLIFGRRRNRNKTKSKTSLWYHNSMEKYQNMTKKKTAKNF